MPTVDAECLDWELYAVLLAWMGILYIPDEDMRTGSVTPCTSMFLTSLHAIIIVAELNER